MKKLFVALLAISCGAAGAVDFNLVRSAIRAVSGKGDLFLPSDSEFNAKWRNFTRAARDYGPEYSMDSAFALIDCTVFGSADEGVLIDANGITAVSDMGDRCENFFLPWDVFAANGQVEEAPSSQSKLVICRNPLLRLNLSGSAFRAQSARILFDGLLVAARNGGRPSHPPRPSHVQTPPPPPPPPPVAAKSHNQGQAVRSFMGVGFGESVRRPGFSCLAALARAAGGGAGRFGELDDLYAFTLETPVRFGSGRGDAVATQGVARAGASDGGVDMVGVVFDSAHGHAADVNALRRWVMDSYGRCGAREVSRESDRDLWSDMMEARFGDERPGTCYFYMVGSERDGVSMVVSLFEMRDGVASRRCVGLFAEDGSLYEFEKGRSRRRGRRSGPSPHGRR